MYHKATLIPHLINKVLSLAKMYFRPEKLVSWLHWIALLQQPVISSSLWSSEKSFFLGRRSPVWNWDVGLIVLKLCIFPIFQLDDNTGDSVFRLVEKWVRLSQSDIFTPHTVRLKQFLYIKIYRDKANAPSHLHNSKGLAKTAKRKRIQ